MENFDIETQLKQQGVDLNIDDEFKDLQDEVNMEGGGGNDSDAELEKLENESNEEDNEDDDKNMNEEDKELAEMENGLDDVELNENEEENNENEEKVNKIENEDNNNNQSNKNSNNSLKRKNQINSIEVNPEIKKINENEEKTKKTNSNIFPDTKEFIKYSNDLIKKYNTLKISLPLKVDSKNKIDYFIEDTDKKYCNYESMESLSEIFYEIKFCEEVLNFKNKNKFKDVDYWKKKKENLQNSLKLLSNNIKNAKLSGITYGLKIGKENKLLKQLGMKLKDDKSLKPFEMKLYFNRIKKRIEYLIEEKKALKIIIDEEKKDIEEKKKKKEDEEKKKKEEEEKKKKEEEEKKKKEDEEKKKKEEEDKNNEEEDKKINNEEENNENEVEEEEVIDYELPIEKDVKEDQFNIKLEENYNNLKFINSLTVLKYESIICQKIVDYKKQNKFDDEDVWENKKINIDLKKKTTEIKIQSEQLSMSQYFKEINIELNYEQTALKKIKTINIKDNKVLENQIKVQINRINKRIELINSDIEQLKEIVQNEQQDKAENNENSNETKVEESPHQNDPTLNEKSSSEVKKIEQIDDKKKQKMEII